MEKIILALSLVILGLIAILVMILLEARDKSELLHSEIRYRRETERRCDEYQRLAHARAAENLKDHETIVELRKINDFLIKELGRAKMANFHALSPEADKIVTNYVKGKEA